jgi:hypothetical protein
MTPLDLVAYALEAPAKALCPSPCSSPESRSHCGEVWIAKGTDMAYLATVEARVRKRSLL